MKNLKYYINKAYKEKFAIGQFNFSTFEQVKGIITAAKSLRSPIILGTSEGEARFFGLQEAVLLRDVLRKNYNLPIFLNLDHCHSEIYLKKAVTFGYDMVHFDGSKLPLQENIKISREVVKYAKWRNVLVEGEVGAFATESSKLYSEDFQIKERDLTDPEQAKKYARQTKVDILAVNVGTFHGLDVDKVSPHIDLERLKEIKSKLKMPLVMHGGSGTPPEDIQKAIELGICKININTGLRLAFTSALRKSLQENPDEIVPYKYLPKTVEAVQKTVEEKIRLFGSTGKV